MKRTVFISHSSQDKKIADAVCNFLEKHGVLCWMAPRDITPGKTMARRSSMRSANASSSF
jgi:hypothetical protein